MGIEIGGCAASLRALVCLIFDGQLGGFCYVCCLENLHCETLTKKH